MNFDLSILSGYPDTLISQVRSLMEDDKLGLYIKARYPEKHDITTNSALAAYVLKMKNEYMKMAPPLQKILYDKSLVSLENALGLHSYVSRVQGKKLKSKNEIRIASLFKKAPAAFLRMIAAHELAHLKEKDHNKKFYSLCSTMVPDYWQLDFDVRLYLLNKTQGVGPSQPTARK